MSAENMIQHGRTALAKYAEAARRRLATFGGDRSGASAIEFALIVPLFLAMYLGTMELGQGIDTNKKVGRSAAMIGDLITQEEASITSDELNAIMKIAEQTLRPYHRSKATIVVAGVEYNAAYPKGRVTWQQRLVGHARKATCPDAQPADVPTALQVVDTFIISVKVCLPYEPVAVWGAPDWTNLGFKSTQAAVIDMREDAFFTPRMSKQIICQASKPEGCKPTTGS